MDPADPGFYWTERYGDLIPGRDQPPISPAGYLRAYRAIFGQYATTNLPRDPDDPYDPEDDEPFRWVYLSPSGDHTGVTDTFNLERAIAYLPTKPGTMLEYTGTWPRCRRCSWLERRPLRWLPGLRRRHNARRHPDPLYGGPTGGLLGLPEIAS